MTRRHFDSGHSDKLYKIIQLASEGCGTNLKYTPFLYTLYSTLSQLVQKVPLLKKAEKNGDLSKFYYY